MLMISCIYTPTTKPQRLGSYSCDCTSLRLGESIPLASFGRCHIQVSQKLSSLVRSSRSSPAVNRGPSASRAKISRKICITGSTSFCDLCNKASWQCASGQAMVPATSSYPRFHAPPSSMAGSWSLGPDASKPSRFDVDVAIVGGGPGGLVTALALLAKGFSVGVYERSEPHRVGALLSLCPNGLEALRIINPQVVEQCLEKAEATQTHMVMAPDGTVVVPPGPHPLLPIQEKFKYPLVNIAWYELTDILRSHLPQGVLHSRHKCTGFTEEDDNGVLVHIEGEEEPIRAGVLVGADGARSTVRAQLTVDGVPPYTGIMSWRGVFDSDPGVIPPHRLVTISDGSPQGGPSRLFLAVDLQERITAWVAFALLPEEPTAGGTSTKARGASEMERVRAAFADWTNETFHGVLGATDPDTLLPLAIRERDSVDASWGKGRVTLVGDSAHLMQPWLGQGTNTSIEDAHVLAEKLAGLLRASGNPAFGPLDDLKAVETVLREYEMERIGRTATIQRWSSKAPLRPLSVPPPKDFVRQFMRRPEEDEWMYTYPVVGPAPVFEEEV